jgi:Amidase
VAGGQGQDRKIRTAAWLDSKAMSANTLPSQARDSTPLEDRQSPFFSPIQRCESTSNSRTYRKRCGGENSRRQTHVRGTRGRMPGTDRGTRKRCRSVGIFGFRERGRTGAGCRPLQDSRSVAWCADRGEGHDRYRRYAHYTGIPYLCGAKAAEWEAACVAAAREAGAIVLGKTVSDEFAYAQAGKTRNPHHLAHTPGGSSSGSAAAVADFMVPLALGTQTGASVIRPASFCGAFGYKASFGEFSLSGIRPFAESLDTLGILARSIAEPCFAAQRVDRGAGSCRHRVAAGAAGYRYLPHGAVGGRRTVRSGRSRAQRGSSTQCGGPRPRCRPTEALGRVDRRTKVITAYEAAHNYVYETTRYAHLLSEPFRILNERGWPTRRDTYTAAKRAVASATAQFGEIIAGYDALVTLAAIGEAPLAATGTGDPVMSRMWTALHVPSLVIPVAIGPRGPPVGVQLISSYGAVKLLLRIGQWLRGALTDSRVNNGCFGSALC